MTLVSVNGHSLLDSSNATTNSSGEGGHQAGGNGGDDTPSLPYAYDEAIGYLAAQFKRLAPPVSAPLRLQFSTLTM